MNYCRCYFCAKTVRPDDLVEDRFCSEKCAVTWSTSMVRLGGYSFKTKVRARGILDRLGGKNG